MNLAWKDLHSANLRGLDILDGCNISVNDRLETSNDVFALIPVSDSTLPSDWSQFPHTGEPEFSFCGPERLDRLQTSMSSNETSQDVDECVDRPYPPLPSRSTPDECCFMSTFDLLGSSWPSETEDNAMVPGVTPMLSKASPINDLSQYSNSPKTQSTSSPKDTTKSSPISDRWRGGHRKRSRAHNQLDTIICADTDPALRGKDRKAHLRGYHNQIEKNYRNRLNNEFNLLFKALAECTNEKELISIGFTEGGPRNGSKGSILRLARRRLLALQTENRLMTNKLKTVRRNWMECQTRRVVKPSN